MNNIFNADHSYISISKVSASRMREMGLIHEDAEFHDLRKTLVAALSETAVLIPGTQETHFLAKVHVKNDTIDREGVLICVLTKGSPAGNKDHTLLIRGAMSLEAAEQLLASKKGLTGLKFDKTVGRIGAASRN